MRVTKLKKKGSKLEKKNHNVEIEKKKTDKKSMKLHN